jgi:hypothetical protein
MFFEILNRNNVLIDKSNIEQIIDMIYFLKFDSVSVHNIAQTFAFDFNVTNIFSLSSLPNESIQTMISSPYIHFQNENQLFDFSN